MLGKGEVSSKLNTSAGIGVDTCLYAVSPQVTSHKPRGRLRLLSTWPAVIFQATEPHNPLASTKLHCLVTRGACYINVERSGAEPASSQPRVQCQSRVGFNVPPNTL